MNRRLFAMIGILILAALLAFPLRDAVYKVVIIPVAYVLWMLGLLYHSVHQSLWWFLVLFILAYILVRSLLPKVRVSERELIKTKPVVGQVENLSMWMKKSERGVYFKWLVANRLGKIAWQILALRETGKQRSVFDPLTSPDWTPDPAVRAYLESGLQRSFADFPQSRNPFVKSEPTALDHDVNATIEFLESQVKK
jgi:hypothetical protein